MKDYILLLPILFIFHDMEEIIGFTRFFQRNPDLFDRFPKVTKPYRGLTHEAFALCVYEEFIPFFGISLLAYYFPCDVLYGLWFGIFLALTGHFFIHIGHTVYIRKYIPSVITSLICLPISILILVRCAGLMNRNAASIISVPAAILLMLGNMKLLYLIMPRLSRKIRSDAQKTVL